MTNESLKQKALEEILSETKRAAARAEVGGSLSWAKPRHSGVNKRFLNKTMIGTLIQNNIVTKSNTSHKQSTSKLLKESPAVKKSDAKTLEDKKEVNVENKKTNSNKRSSKIIISNKARLNAYLKSKKEKRGSDSSAEGK